MQKSHLIDVHQESLASDGVKGKRVLLLRVGWTLNALLALRLVCVCLRYSFV